MSPEYWSPHQTAKIKTTNSAINRTLPGVHPSFTQYKTQLIWRRANRSQGEHTAQARHHGGADTHPQRFGCENNGRNRISYPSTKCTSGIFEKEQKVENNSN